MRYASVLLLCCMACIVAAVFAAGSAEARCHWNYYYWPDPDAAYDDTFYEWDPGYPYNVFRVDEHDNAQTRDNVSTTETSTGGARDYYWATGPGSDNQMQMVAWVKALGSSGSNDFKAIYYDGVLWRGAIDVDVPAGPPPTWYQYKSSNKSVSACSKFRIWGRRNPPAGTLLCDEIYFGEFVCD